MSELPFFFFFLPGAQGLLGPQGLPAALAALAAGAGASAASTAGAGVIMALATASADRRMAKLEGRFFMGSNLFISVIAAGLIGLPEPPPLLAQPKLARPSDAQTSPLKDTRPPAPRPCQQSPTHR